MYRLLRYQSWWRLVRRGCSAFVDMGSVRRLDGLGWTLTRAEAGLGPYLGNPQSSLGRAIHLSVTLPVNKAPHQARWQFTIGNTLKF